jgi:gliding motility-associated-like protein
MTRYPLIFFSLISFLCLKTQAQVCTGSLGDPTVTQNFGIGTGIGPSLPSANTSYKYNGNDCPDDGFYAINNKTSNCFNNTWHTLSEDHTPGDVNGYMMIVNATVETGVFYTFSVDNLCPNTTYEFASYIVNLIKPNAGCGVQSKPKITFNVEKEDGTVIGTYSTGFIDETSSPLWRKFGFFFKNPSNVSKVILKLINNAAGGCGNDLALDDITFRPCGPSILAKEVNSNAGSNLTLCEGNTADYSFSADVSDGYQNPAFLWQEDKHDGNGFIDIPNSNSKTYQALITNAEITGYSFRMAAAEKENISSINCRVYSNPIEVSVVKNLVIDAGNDIFVLENASIKILASAPVDLIYQWTPPTYLSDSKILQPIVKPAETTTYQLMVTDPNSGCVAIDNVTVHVDLDIKIPNTFSPNGDGVNDLWQIQGLLGSSDADITVFNRNGQQVYYSKGYPKAWDGKLKNTNLPSGMYYYIIDTHSQTRPIYSGSLLIFY